jgi:deoxyribodipyrimidine photolyase-related protein
MSNNCTKCQYNVKKFGDKACPFNTLYWNFLDEKNTSRAINEWGGI